MGAQPMPSKILANWYSSHHRSVTTPKVQNSRLKGVKTAGSVRPWEGQLLSEHKCLGEKEMRSEIQHINLTI